MVESVGPYELFWLILKIRERRHRQYQMQRKIVMNTELRANKDTKPINFQLDEDFPSR